MLLYYKKNWKTSVIDKKENKDEEADLKKSKEVKIELYVKECKSKIKLNNLNIERVIRSK